MDLQKCRQLAADILDKTNDGSDLSAEDLKLLEFAIEGYVNEAGEEKLCRVCEQVIAGEYVKGQPLGVEHLGMEQDGYIYFKNNRVAHTNTRWLATKEGKNYLQELQQWCLQHEKVGEKITYLAAMLWCIERGTPVKTTAAHKDKRRNDVDRGR